jgi:hypothetical protein
VTKPISSNEFTPSDFINHDRTQRIAGTLPATVDPSDMRGLATA